MQCNRETCRVEREQLTFPGDINPATTLITDVFQQLLKINKLKPVSGGGELGWGIKRNSGNCNQTEDKLRESGYNQKGK